MISYRLAVLTHGHMATLEETLASFDEWVSEPPAERFLVVDGPKCPDVARSWASRFDEVTLLHEKEGFCGATEELWNWSQKPGVDYVFWLEGDFLFRRKVPINRMAAILEAKPNLGQISLIRNAANSEELLAGGLVAAHPEWWVRHETPWAHMTQTAYWTTNPSLISREFMTKNHWPEGPECEGKFTIQLRSGRPGIQFAVLGLGEEWIEHIGQRDKTGSGY